jgi:Zn-dependent peptidase ImmA (M78 family)
VAATIAKREGLKVFGVDFSKDFGVRHIDGLINPKEKTMYINEEYSPKRQNFAIAHELGHWVLEHTEEEAYNDIVFRQTDEEKKHNPLEREADFFAANLLMPVKFFIRLAAKYPELSVFDTFRLFGVPEEAFVNRMRFLGL